MLKKLLKKYSDIKNVLTGNKLTYPDIKIFVHPLANFLVILFDFLKISPNFVTILCFGSSVMSLFFFIENNYFQALFFFWARIIIDYSDGCLARYTNNTSDFGAKLDRGLDYFFYFSLWLIFFIKLKSFMNYYFIFSVIFYFIFVNYYLEVKVKKKRFYTKIKNFFIKKKIIIGISSMCQLEFYSLLLLAIDYESIIFYLITLHNLDLVLRYYEHLKTRKF